MKYQIGDRVLVRDDLEIYGESDNYDTAHYAMEDGSSPVIVVDSMRKAFGMVVEILGESDVISGTYSVACEGFPSARTFAWTDEMFVGLAEDATWEAPDLAAFLE